MGLSGTVAARLLGLLPCDACTFWSFIFTSRFNVIIAFFWLDHAVNVHTCRISRLSPLRCYPAHGDLRGGPARLLLELSGLETMKDRLAELSAAVSVFTCFTPTGTDTLNVLDA